MEPMHHPSSTTLGKYLLGRLSRKETGEVAQHLMMCTHCLEHASLVEERIGKHWVPSQTVDAEPETMALVRPMPVVIHRRRRPRIYPKLVAAAAVALLVAGISISRVDLRHAALQVAPPQIAASAPAEAMNVPPSPAVDPPVETPKVVAHSFREKREPGPIAVFHPPVLPVKEARPILLEPPKATVLHASIGGSLSVVTQDLPDFVEKKRHPLRRFFGKVAAPFRSSGPSGNGS